MRLIERGLEVVDSSEQKWHWAVYRGKESESSSHYSWSWDGNALSISLLFPVEVGVRCPVLAAAIEHGFPAPTS